MGRLHDFIAEWKARRRGAKYTPRGIQKSAREVIGPTGDLMSSAWDRMAEGSDAYLDSFDRRIPPSIFVSERDKTRMNRPIPLAERRIEAYQDDSDDLTEEEIKWGNEPPSG